MADFKRALDRTLTMEGKYNNDFTDPGGETYKGISRRYNPEWMGWDVIDSKKSKSGFPVNLEDDNSLQNLVEIIYKKKYWTVTKGEETISQVKAESVFDYSVNVGTYQCAKDLQSVLKVVLDGVIGPITISALNSAECVGFMNSFMLSKITRYLIISNNNKNLRKYFYGWVNRAENMSLER